MTNNLQSERHFEENVEAFYKHMGYRTQTNTVLHTRPVDIHAHLDHPKGKQKVIVECKHLGEPVRLHEVQRFCCKIAFARDKAQADLGVLVSDTGFSEDAVIWVAKHCSFVRLRTYKQVVTRSAKVNKLVKKFDKPNIFDLNL
ncbi:MAG: restriction endonuclease [Candidatus Bathyarchaeia archaeon]